MNEFLKWAERHNISAAAIADIPNCVVPPACQPPANITAQGEAGVQARVSVEASERGWRVWRNNRGAVKDDKGNYFRFGLANTSKRLGDAIKSADLIGINPRVITYDDVGKTIGQFISIECKAPGVNVTNRNDKHTVAQKRWAHIINGLGGYAVITSGGLE